MNRNKHKFATFLNLVFISIIKRWYNKTAYYDVTTCGYPKKVLFKSFVFFVQKQKLARQFLFRTRFSIKKEKKVQNYIITCNSPNFHLLSQTGLAGKIEVSSLTEVNMVFFFSDHFIELKMYERNN